MKRLVWEVTVEDNGHKLIIETVVLESEETVLKWLVTNYEYELLLKRVVKESMKLLAAFKIP